MIGASWAFLPAVVLVVAAPGEASGPEKGKEAEEAALEAQIRKALASEDPAEHRAALKAIQGFRFTQPRSPTRELALFAEGTLRDRLGDPLKAAESLRKLERLFPRSPYLPEAQVILGQEALERRRFKDAESRLRRAINGEIPAEAKRRAQELLLAAYVEQDQPERGLPVVESLQPLGTAKPSERGLAAMVEVLAHAGRKDEAGAARQDFQKLYPDSRRKPRVELAYGRMLGASGDALGAAHVFQPLIQAYPNTPEADEARLALATLLSEKKIEPQQASAFPAPESLLSDLRKVEAKADAGRRALFIQLRLQVQGAKWKEALDTVAKLREKPGSPDEQRTLATYRQEALRAWTQVLLDGQQLEPLLPFLDREGVASLTPEQRSLVVKRLAQVGLPSAAAEVIRLAPAQEQAALRGSALASLTPELHPHEALSLLPGKNEGPSERLLRAEAAVAAGDWKAARAALPGAQPGPRRIDLAVATLRRPRGPEESPAARKAEAEAWLIQAKEKGPAREPLTLLVADLRVQVGDWKGALALYPAEPAPAQRGWVALMRATCLRKLGQAEAAKAVLRQAADEPAFKMERQTLGKELGL